MASTLHMQGQMQGASGPFAPLATLMTDATAAVLDGIRGLTVNPFATLVRLQDRAEQRRRLSEMDDHLLEDIGLTRAQARKEAGKLF